MRTHAIAATFVLGAATGPLTAQEAYLRVVDVGAGLCVVAVTPEGHAMLYDAGRGTPRCRDAVRELVPDGRIDLLVLSHSDIDHVRETVAILADNEVATIIHPGDPRGPLLIPIRAAIDQEPDADVWNLTVRPVPFGKVFAVGSAKATFVAGWSDGHATQGPDEPSLRGKESVRNNALSAVIRFEYGGRSVLLTGDTVGRQDYSSNRVCQYAERLLVANAEAVPLKSDVLVGQHHGADNATANCFIRAVAPTFVVFSAGHQHHHPRQSTADRLVAYGVVPDNILRTDRGDNEGGTGRAMEWIYGALAGCKDEPGDDDIEIRLPSDPTGVVNVTYRTPSAGC